MKIRLVTTICTIASAMMAAAQVPSLINYQGRLTDASGAPVTGSKNFSLSIYDAATGGNLLYTETIGAVTLDANGVYNFQFGDSGTSNSQVTETLATTDAATLVYVKALTNTGIVENSITVTDGTNIWSQSAGNPGAGATATANTIAGFVIGATITNGGSGYTSPPAVTIIGNGTGAAATAVLTEGVVTGITITSAGSGYTGTPTITIAPPVIPLRVDYNSGTITATYSGAPSAGRAITASYRYGTNGITGALASGAEHWMAVSVAGIEETTRQRIISAPFSYRSKIADTVTSRSNITYAINTLNNPTHKEATRMPLSIIGTSPELSRKTGDYPIPKTIKRINSIRANLSAKHFKEGDAPWQTSYRTGIAKISLFSINSEGLTTELLSQSHIGTSESGTTLDAQIGPIELDHEENEYFIHIKLDLLGVHGTNQTTEYARAEQLKLNVNLY